MKKDNHLINYLCTTSNKLTKCAHFRQKIKKILRRKRIIRQICCMHIKVARLSDTDILSNPLYYFIKKKFFKKIIRNIIDKDCKSIIRKISNATNSSINCSETNFLPVNYISSGLQNLLQYNPVQFVNEIKRLNNIINITTYSVDSSNNDSRKIRLAREVIRLENIVSGILVDEILHAIFNVDSIFGPIFDDSYYSDIAIEPETLLFFKPEFTEELTWTTVLNNFRDKLSKKSSCFIIKKTNNYEEHYSDLDYKFTKNKSLKYVHPICKSMGYIDNFMYESIQENEQYLEDVINIKTERIFSNFFHEIQNEYFERRDERIIEMIISFKERVVYSNSLLNGIINSYYGNKRISKLCNETFNEEHEIKIFFLSKMSISEWQFGLFLEKHKITNFKLTRFDNAYSFRTHYASDLYKFIDIFNKKRGTIKLPYMNDDIEYQITFPRSLTLNETYSRDKIMFTQRSKYMDMIN
ncbi:Hypothetical protein SRAE_X000001100 [Strongyloides ratti]|uniref:Uncharacterized protein n=1 Tax=Strongyloides ratti TaxID=34506 RepID=A0A090LLJ7_STRRB|nr:Hypothetical protein SRAE_X000001100 [Strongyloides ratti]CEF70680.1 Hypothetical protein SRAE_X000001100 [Strongyloides ratti]